MAMEKKIKYGIYPNPLPNEKGETTYQVRHEPNYTMDTRDFLDHLEFHNRFDKAIMTSALIVLKDEIVEQLQDNKRFRIDGLGTFQMKVGLKTKVDDEGNEVKQVITNPKSITARDVEVTGVSFIPDPSFVRELKRHTAAKSTTVRGRVSGSSRYTREQVVKFLDAYLEKYHFITRQALRANLGLSQHAAIKWLETLCNEESPKYVARKEGTTIVYRRYDKEASLP